jgi:ribosome-binding ATPase YchF (GTP1/OBG family)
VHPSFHYVYITVVQARKEKKSDPTELNALEKANAALLAGKPVRSAGLTPAEKDAIKTLMLLTGKAVIYAANVADADLAQGNAMSQKVFEYAAQQGAKAVLVSAQVGLVLFSPGSVNRVLSPSVRVKNL